jgi:hypothetical protein
MVLLYGNAFEDAENPVSNAGSAFLVENKDAR